MTKKAETLLSFLSSAFFLSLFLASPTKADSPLTDQNFGGIGGVYHVESNHWKGVAVIEALILPISGQEFDLCFWFRSKALADIEWEYSEGYKCAPLRPFPSQSIGCQADSYCFTSNLEGVDYFFDFSPDYHLVDYIVWTNAAAESDVYRLYRKQDEEYESWLREFAEEGLYQVDNKSSFQMYGTGFVINKDFVVTADHVLRDKPSSRQCNHVEVSTNLGRKWEQARIHGVDPFLDIAVIKLSKPKKRFANLSLESGLDEGASVSHYGLADWSGYRGRFELTGGQIIPHISQVVEANTNLTQKAIFSNLSGQKGDSGGAILNDSGNVVGVLLGGENKDESYVYGIKSTILAGFLDARRVPYETVVSTKPLTSEQIERRAETFTVLVRCKHRGVREKDNDLSANRK